MELELKKECLDVFEAGDRQTLTQEETAETIVPDYCPDIARIISAEGCVYLHGAEPSGTSGTRSGNGALYARGRERCADVGICNVIFRAGKRYG